MPGTKTRRYAMEYLSLNSQPNRIKMLEPTGIVENFIMTLNMTKLLIFKFNLPKVPVFDITFI